MKKILLIEDNKGITERDCVIPLQNLNMSF